MTRLLWAATAITLSLITWRADAASPPRQAAQPPAQPAPAAKPDDAAGIPITNKVVRDVCASACHKVDDKGRISRISYRRTTPEGWQETVRRMVTLNKAEMEPQEAREVVKYLSDHLGLAPEEVKPGTFEVERRLIDYKYSANADTERVCSSCHSMGRVILQRRSDEEWNLLLAMHRGFYPLVDFQVFRRFGPPSTEPGPDGRPPDNRHPMDKALAHLKSAFPLTTREWSAWSATMRTPRIEGQWALAGYEIGQGPIYGRVTISGSTTSPDDFQTNISYTYARSGRTVTRTGRAIVYTGFQWRGRSTVGSDEGSTLREVLLIERDWQSMSGRWFTGAYDELGLDVSLSRIGREVVVSGVDRVGLRKPATRQALRIYGANFPSTLAPRDFDLGRGVTVSRVVSVEPTLVTVEVDVTAEAPIGARDLYVSGVAGRAAVTVYDRPDYVKVAPSWNMARVGGAAFPKMLAQFEAVAYHHGPDGKPDTPDDLNLGAVDAIWSMAEYTATYVDDDLKFVGEIDAKSGRFTPALDGPNPSRSGNRNNIGDVWVIAVHAPGGDASALRARAHLVVTVPLYMRWDFFTVHR